MGKIAVFSLDSCPYCKKAKELLREKGAEFEEISLTKTPEWRQLLYLITNGKTSVPEIFFNDRLIGGQEDLQELEDKGQLDELIKECLSSPSLSDFPPPLRRPKSEEFLKIIPDYLLKKWQSDLEALDSKLGGTSDNPISSLLIMLGTPEEMVVLCTAGKPGTDEFVVGFGGQKGREGTERKSYCQVVIEKNVTLFIDGPDQLLTEFRQNNDWTKFGYGYYIGAPWRVGETTGTVVAMEKKPGILKPEHKPIIEELSDTIERELGEYRTTL